MVWPTASTRMFTAAPPLPSQRPARPAGTPPAAVVRQLHRELLDRLAAVLVALRAARVLDGRPALVLHDRARDPGGARLLDGGGQAGALLAVELAVEGELDRGDEPDRVDAVG